MGACAPAPQSKGRNDVEADPENSRRVSPQAQDPSSLAKPTLRRQTPEVGAECPNGACSDLCGGCVKKTRERHAVRKMKVDPSEPPCRGRLQTTISCFGQKPRW